MEKYFESMVKIMFQKTSCVFLLTIYVVFCILSKPAYSQPVTDPIEAAALNKIFRDWKISGTPQKWNVSGELCSGTAIDSSEWTIQDYNPLIKCDCSYEQNTTCHITHLKVYAVDVVGTIPEEFYNLTYLTHVNLDQNYLTGSLSSSIGNLNRMQRLSLGINALSGKFPEEIGQLTDLVVLGMGSNNFSGPLPASLGNCLKLQEIYFDSSGVSGEIPSTFAKLVNMQTVWGSDTELTGNIPDFIGNWSKLISLRLQGNSFEGSIPSTFSRLESLTELRISDLSNGSSSLAFLKASKSLTTLILRNNKISGSIASNIGEYNKLTQLDLSFNELTGEIPDVLFNISSLSYLFLGNNNLTGTLPTQKSSSLRNIDLSHNSLSGSFPTWINQQNLSVNLVANNFTFDSANISVFPGLNCLQQNFPCNRGHGRYYDFAVKCGGPQMKSTSGTLFASDSVSLGPASYYVNDEERWAVSNAGLFTGSNNPQYISNSLSQFTNTLDSELFQTARISPSSLRYYGLGLENGNYTLSLQFAEHTILSSTTWKSLGRRVFDIYIQGNLVLQNFDIHKEADGSSFKAIEKQFKVVVSENYIEVHLFWAGKGTCCIPAQGTYGPSISTISAQPDFVPTVSNSNPSSKKNSTGLIVGLVLGISCFLLLITAFFFIQRRKGRRTIEDEELLGIDAYTYSYSELRTATDDFSLSNKLGEGGFGPVFQGTLNDGRSVAVKQLSVASHQGKSQFLTEIATISAVQHRNLVKLYGCCIEGSQRLLVYEYLENNSLDQALFQTGNQNLDLNWPTRYEICLGVARGLAYLHEESRLRIVHRDVKASNILLDADLVPKISDFGLAKLYDDKKTHISTRVAGTIGYLAPEYAMRGHLTEKADVFGFGVVALEVVSGRPNSDASLEAEKMYLLEWAWHLHENNREMELVDPRVTDFTEEEVKRVIGIALLCTQTSPTLRPAMSRVVAMLSGDAEVSTITSKPGYLTDWKFNDVTTFMSDASDKGIDTSQYNSTASTSHVMDGSSPYNVSRPMLNDMLGEGR